MTRIFSSQAIHNMTIANRANSKKISRTLMGHSVSEETREKIREARKLQIITPETRLKKSLTMKKLWKKSFGKRMRGLCSSSNHRLKLSLAHCDGSYDTYGSSHKYIIIKFGRADHCDNCHKKDRYYEWSNLNHKYDINEIDLWLQLCRLCHQRYDSGKIKIRGLTIKERGTEPILFGWNKYHFNQGHNMRYN